MLGENGVFGGLISWQRSLKLKDTWLCLAGGASLEATWIASRGIVLWLPRTNWSCTAIALEKEMPIMLSRAFSRCLLGRALVPDVPKRRLNRRRWLPSNTRRLRLEPLEDRRLLAVALNWPEAAATASAITLPGAHVGDRRQCQSGRGRRPIPPEHDAHRHPHRADKSPRLGLRLQRQPLRGQLWQQHGEQVRTGEHHAQRHPHRADPVPTPWLSTPAATSTWPTLAATR